MFYFLEDFDIANYVGDSTSYCAGKSAEFALNQTITFIYYFTILFQYITETCEFWQRKCLNSPRFVSRNRKKNICVQNKFV